MKYIYIYIYIMHIHTKCTASVKSLQQHRFVSTHGRRHLPNLHNVMFRPTMKFYSLLSVLMSKNGLFHLLFITKEDSDSVNVITVTNNWLLKFCGIIVFSVVICTIFVNERLQKTNNSIDLTISKLLPN